MKFRKLAAGIMSAVMLATSVCAVHAGAYTSQVYDVNNLKEDEEYPDDPSEDYYCSFETYLEVLATSSMSIINECTPEKLAGYIYLSRNMNKSGTAS